MPLPRTVAVSWFAGDRSSRPERAELYDLAALADDLRALVATVAPKGTGAVLCPATFGALDGEPDLDAPRRGEALQRATLVQLDVDGAEVDGAPSATMRDALAVLGAWGVAAVVWPSPSAVGPALDAVRFRVLVQIAPDVPTGRRDRRLPPSSAAARRALVRLARSCLPGSRVDEGPALNPGALAFVHPRHAPRSPGDVVLVHGRAVDLATLAALAVTAGVVPPYDASPDRHTHGALYDLDALRELAAAAGLATHQRGRVTATECPRAAEHTSGGRGERGDTSCAIGPWREPWRCEHSHGGDGKLRAGALVRLALALVRDPAVRDRLDAVLHAAEGPVARVRGRLDAPERTAPELFAADIGEHMREVGRAVRATLEREGRAAALVCVPPGSGKSAGVGALVDACAPPPASHEREGDGPAPSSPRPVAVVLVDQRARVGAIARSLLTPDAGPRRLPLVHQPVSRVMAPDGRAECTYERASGAASAIERAGGNARSVLCIDGRCPRAAAHDCPAHDALVPHDGDGPRPSLAAELGEDAPRVVVATHAAPSFPRAGGVLVVDEAHGAPWQSVEVTDTDPSPLHHAASLARWQKGEGTADATALVCAALYGAPSALREVDVEARLAWATDRVCESRAFARIAGLLGAELGEDAPADGRARVVAALVRWRDGDGFALRAERRGGRARAIVRRWADGSSGVAADAGEALRAVRAWLGGCRVDAVTSDDGAPVGTLVSWDAPATRAARAWHERGGIVVQMDATGDAGVAAAMLGGAPVQVFGARIPDRREVTREVIADTRGTARSQFTGGARGGARAIRWDRVSSALDAVRARIVAWQSSHPGVDLDAGCLARQPIARALAAFWALPSTGGDLARAVDQACVDLRAESALTRTDVARELGALLSSPRELARASDLRALVPRVRWTYPGHELARGSNDLRGATVLVQLGDFRPPPAAVAAVAARTGREVDHEAARAARDVAVQWFGRARVVRDGPPVLLVHVGELPPRDWCGRGAEVIAAGAQHRAVAAPGLETGPVAAPPPPADTPAARAVGALLAAGWTPAELARRLAAPLARSAPSIARTLRRWRAGGEAHDAALLLAVNDLAREARSPADALRARVVFLARGRGIARVWSGASGVVGLRALADRAGSAVDLDALERFAGGVDLPAVVDLLQRDPGTGGTVLGAVEAAHGIAPPPPLTPAASSPERARVVAEGAVEGSAWSRPDALRLRPGASRAVARRRPPSPLATPAAAPAPPLRKASPP